MTVAGDTSSGNLLDCGIDGIEPPLHFITARHFILRLRLVQVVVGSAKVFIEVPTTLQWFGTENPGPRTPRFPAPSPLSLELLRIRRVPGVAPL